MAVQDYELLLRVRADMLEAIKGMDGLSASIGGAKAAADATGESADAAAQRIQKMVAATSQQVQVQESARSQAERAAQTANATIRSYDDQANAIRRATDAAAEYRARSASATGSGSSNAAAAALDAERAAMAKLAGQIDPTVAALAKLDAQETQLNTLRKAGVVGLEDYTAFKTLIDQSRASITGAATAMHGFTLNTSQGRLEISRLIKDLATGNFGRLQQTSLTLANQAGFTSTLFSPLGLGIAAATAALGGFVLAEVSVERENETLTRAIQQTGNVTGTTVGQINQLANGLATARTGLGITRDIITQLVASGRVGSQSLGSLAQAAVDMAELTGQSADKATASVLTMFDGTAAGALKANDQYHFLTTAIYDQIKALEEEGDTQAAMDVAADAFHRAAIARIQDMNSQLGGLVGWWNKVKTAAADAWERMKTGASLVTGSADDQTQLYALQGRKESAANHEYSALGRARNMFAGSAIIDQFSSSFEQWTPEDEAKLQALQAKVDAANRAAADAATSAQLNDAAVHADAGLDKLASAIDSAYAKKDKIKELNKYFNDLWAGADPNNPKLNGVQRFVANDGSVNYSGGLYDTLLGDINKGKKPASTRGVDNAAATAQASLLKLLNDEQGAVDPVAKVWATYNDVVTRANDLADKAAKGKGANVAAIHAERDAVIEVAAKTRDAALDQYANKDRLAFEKLRDSLSGIKGVSFGPIIADLDKLNKYLKDGTISAQEYKDTAGKVLDQNLPKLPDFVGADATVTGPFGELDKLNSQADKLQQAYQAQLDALNAWHEKTLDSDAAFVEKENELYAAHATQMQKIDDARQQVMLTGLTSSLSAAASALKDGLGQQSVAYRAAFAISKAAAIAEASINLYKAISKASSDLPYPANIAAMVAVGAQGAALVAAIAGINAGFSDGGYTGPGGKQQPAGVVHKGEVVYSQADVARHGGVAAVEAHRLGLPGYADGGVVMSRLLSRYPSPVDADATPAMLAANDNRSNNGGNNTGTKLRIVNSVDPQFINDWANSSEGETVIMNVLGRNRTTLKAFNT